MIAIRYATYACGCHRRPPRDTHPDSIPETKDSDELQQVIDLLVLPL